MTEPTQLILREWHKSDVVFTLLDWQPRRGLAIVLDPKGDRQTICLILPGSSLEVLLGLNVMFPAAPPSQIEEIILLPPPCRAAPREAELLRSMAEDAHRRPNSSPATDFLKSAPWERAWLRHRHTVLFPSPEDDARLKERLAAFKRRMR